MEIDRRHLAIAGAAAFAAANLPFDSVAFAADDPALSQAVEELRKAILSADKAKLTALTADELTYGHSDGRVQDKAVFIDGVVTRKATVKSLEFSELKSFVAGDAGVTRHHYVADNEQDGKTTHIDIGVLAVWQKQGGSWKLLARQAYKLGDERTGVALARRQTLNSALPRCGRKSPWRQYAGSPEYRAVADPYADHVVAADRRRRGAGADAGAHRVLDPGARGGRPVGGVFDRDGNMLAQAVTGTPGHVNSMAAAVKHFPDAFPLKR